LLNKLLEEENKKVILRKFAMIYNFGLIRLRDVKRQFIHSFLEKFPYCLSRTLHDIPIHNQTHRTVAVAWKAVP